MKMYIVFCDNCVNELKSFRTSRASVKFCLCFSISPLNFLKVHLVSQWWLFCIKYSECVKPAALSLYMMGRDGGRNELAICDRRHILNEFKPKILVISSPSKL